MKYILAFLVLILMPTTLLAQDKMDYFRGLVQTFEDRVFPRLLDQMSNSDRKILRSVDFQFIENPVVVTAVYTESDTKKVYIYAGFLDGLYNYVDCLIITKISDGRKACDKYFDYYFGNVVSKSPTPPLSFAEIIFTDDTKLEAWQNNTTMNDAKNLYMMSALILIGMHEMGHHITGFAQKNALLSDRRGAEIKADKWAVDNLVRMNENPILGITMSLGYLSQIERFRRIKQVNSFSSHPMPKSRAQYAFDKVCVGKLSSPMQKSCDLISGLIDEFE
ncbi:hypothetical protein EH243_17665 [Amphritea opalescens]|uniref:Uncharacterized protein n=1 Tax=Amphritea opalescens TaxID=2490544 RepID=A0A430KLQ7_9GAMM|nr:hypothetical protein [Amphritea opalescens]RTE64396.1 hypothetical protein EH243_17665 [Amphritea opalescens]